jgi:hypothetical protein
MNPSDLTPHQQMLIRRALGPIGSSSRVLLAAQACDELIREHNLTSPQMRARLEQIAADPFQSWQGARAARMASRLLLVLDGEPEEQPGRWRPNFELDDFSLEERLAWLPLELPQLMVWSALGLHWGDVYRLDRVDPEVDWVLAEEAKILESEDPLAAAASWLKSPPEMPARISRGRRRGLPPAA